MWLNKAGREITLIVVLQVGIMYGNSVENPCMALGVEFLCLFLAF